MCLLKGALNGASLEQLYLDHFLSILPQTLKPQPVVAQSAIISFSDKVSSRDKTARETFKSPETFQINSILVISPSSYKILLNFTGWIQN